MHTVIMQPSGLYAVEFHHSNILVRIVYLTPRFGEAFAVASYLNGGAYPPMWVAFSGKQNDPGK